MPIHKSHNRPKPQVPRHDELPEGVPDPTTVPTGPSQRGPDGRFLPGNAISRVGGHRKRRLQQHLHALGLGWMEQHPGLAPARRRGDKQLKAEQQWVAGTVGGGVLDPLAAAELRNAVTKETLAHLCLENPKMMGGLGATVAVADKLLTAARGHRLTALELAARGAEARVQQGDGVRVAVGAIDVSGELAELQRLLGAGQDAAGSHRCEPPEDGAAGGER